MLIEKAREYARRESAVAIHLHHALLACADAPAETAGQILRQSGWHPLAETGATTGDGEAPHQLAPELVLHLAWANGLRTGLSARAEAEADLSVGLLLSCVLGPTSSAHAWLQRHGVDLDLLCARSSAALGLDESACARRERWSRKPVTVPAENVAEVTLAFRVRGEKYKVNIKADGTAVLIPEERPN